MNLAFEIPLKEPKDLLFFRFAVYILAFVTPLLRNLTQALAIAVLLSGIWLAIRGRKRRRLPRWESLSLLAFIALFIISAIIGGIKDAAPQLGKIWVLLCFFPIVAFSDGISKRVVAGLLLWATVFASVIGIARYYLYDLDRAAALSGGYTTLALFEAAMLPLALILFLQERQKWLYAIAIVIVSLGLFLTETRAGWLAALIGVVIAGFYQSKKATLIALIVALAAAAILPQTRAIIEKRMETAKPGGITSGRGILWSYAMTPLSDLPIFGYGPGSFNRLMPREVLAKTGDMGIKSWHSTPLEALLESGPFALLALLAFALLCLVHSWRNYFRAKRMPLELGIFASLMVVYITGLSTNLLRDMMLTSFLVLLWLMIFNADKSIKDNPQVSE